MQSRDSSRDNARHDDSRIDSSTASGHECGVCEREFDTKRGLNIHQSAVHQTDDKPYTDEEKLRELYHGEGLSMREVAKELGTDHDRIAYWMGVHGIERRDVCMHQDHASYKTNYGYPVWKVHVDGTHHRVPVHRLLAVSEYGTDAVAGNDVHHENGIRWDNRPDNIEPLDPAEHRRKHGLENADEQRELMNNLREQGKLNNGGEA